MEQNDFYNSIDIWISKPKETWNHITLMAYFCHKYEVANGVKFRMARWSGDPGKSKESRDFSKIFKMFLDDKDDKGKAEATYKVYNYINWIFDYKFRSGEKSVTGTGIFLLPSMINEFERMYDSYVSKASKVEVLSEYISWCKENIPNIFKYHQIDDIDDLKMLSAYFDSSGFETSTIEGRAIFKASKMGLL